MEAAACCYPLINLQPYSVFTYEGVLDLTPSIDTWVETRQKPNLVIRDNTAYNAVRDMSLAMRKLNIGTVWGGWKKSAKTKTKIKEVSEEVLTVTPPTSRLLKQASLGSVLKDSGEIQDRSWDGTRVPSVCQGSLTSL